MTIGLDQEILGLYMDLLKQKVKDQYRGHQDYHLMLNEIDSRVPIVGGKINVQKEDRHGNFSTVTYNVTVKDDLGNFIQSIDDLGGQCMKGEIVKKGSIFVCSECGGLFCRRHVKFVDNNPQKPLCRYGFMKREGCYFFKWKYYTDGGIKKIQEKTGIINAEAELVKAQKKLEAIQEGRIVIGEDEGLKILPSSKKKTGLLGRLIHGSVYSIHCGNYRCKRMISFADITCPGCRSIITIDVDDSLNCPMCGEPITQVKCPYCEGTNEL